MSDPRTNLTYIEINYRETWNDKRECSWINKEQVRIFPSHAVAIGNRQHSLSNNQYNLGYSSVNFFTKYINQ